MAALARTFAPGQNISNQAAMGGGTFAPPPPPPPPPPAQGAGAFAPGQNIFNQAATGMTQAFQGTAGAAGMPNIGAFQNPYTQDVINRTQQDIARQQEQSFNTLGAQAAAAGAFGGSRHGVAQGVMAGQYGQMAGDIAAQQRQAGFNTSLQAAQQQQGQQLAAAGQMGNLSGQAFGMGQGITGMQQSYGAQQQAMQQAVIDAARNQYAGFQGAPAQAMQYNLAAMSGMPAMGSQTQSYRPGIFDYMGAGMNIYNAWPQR